MHQQSAQQQRAVTYLRPKHQRNEVKREEERMLHNAEHACNDEDAAPQSSHARANATRAAPNTHMGAQNRGLIHNMQPQSTPSAAALRQPAPLPQNIADSPLCTTRWSHRMSCTLVEGCASSDRNSYTRLFVAANRATAVAVTHTQ